MTGVWYGNDDGSPTKKITGGNLPAQTFAAFMLKRHKGVPVSDLPGYYLPETVAVVPTPNPGKSALKRAEWKADLNRSGKTEWLPIMGEPSASRYPASIPGHRVPAAR